MQTRGLQGHRGCSNAGASGHKAGIDRLIAVAEAVVTIDNMHKQQVQGGGSQWICRQYKGNQCRGTEDAAKRMQVGWKKAFDRRTATAEAVVMLGSKQGVMRRAMAARRMSDWR